MKKKLSIVVAGMIFALLMVLNVQSTMDGDNSNRVNLEIKSQEAIAQGGGWELGNRCWCDFWTNECASDGTEEPCAPPYYLVCEDYLDNCPP